LQHGVPRTELRLLEREADVRGGKGCSHFLPAVTVDDADVPGAQSACGVDHMLDEAPTAQPVEDFRQRRVHSRALAGSKDHDV
jgi:hypothetical protein